jgi:hypothetical protein
MPVATPSLIVHKMMRILAPLSAFSATVALCVGLWGATAALADPQDTAEFRKGACAGAYPGWLRGKVDGYNEMIRGPVTDPSSILPRAPTPKSLTTANERLGYGDGLKAGFKAGVDYGVELGRAARTPDSNTRKMDQALAEFDAYLRSHCGDSPAGLDWNTTFMNDRGSATVASLNEAQVAMHLAAGANQAAIVAEKSARGAQEAEAKGDQPVALKFRLTAQLSAQTAASLAEMARSHAATGLEEAIQAINDAQAAADRARKSADSAGG